MNSITEITEDTEDLFHPPVGMTDDQKAAVLRASLLNIGRLLPFGTEMIFYREEGDCRARLQINYSDGEVFRCAFLGHGPIYKVPEMAADDDHMWAGWADADAGLSEEDSDGSFDGKSLTLYPAYYNDPSRVWNALLLISDTDVSLDVVASWTSDQRKHAAEWALLTHYAASDHAVIVPPRPEFLGRLPDDNEQM